MEVNEQELSRRYLAYLDELGPTGRVRIGLALFSEKVNQLKSEVLQKNPGLSERAVHLRGMQNLYSDDSETVRIIGLIAEQEDICLDNIID